MLPTLNADVLYSIAIYLPVHDRLTLRLVNKRWKDISTKAPLYSRVIVYCDLLFTAPLHIFTYGQVPNLHSIQTLELLGCGDSTAIVTQIAIVLTNLSSLSLPSLSSCRAEYIDTPNLTHLRLESNYGIYLTNLTRLRSLSLISGRNIGQLASLPIERLTLLGGCYNPNSLTRLSHLTHLHIRVIKCSRLVSLKLRSLNIISSNVGDDFSLFTSLRCLTARQPLSIPSTLVEYHTEYAGDLREYKIERLRCFSCSVSYEYPLIREESCGGLYSSSNESVKWDGVPSTLTHLETESNDMFLPTTLRSLKIRKVSLHPFPPKLESLYIKRINKVDSQCIDRFSALTSLRSLTFKRITQAERELLSTLPYLSSLQYVTIAGRTFTTCYDAIRYIDSTYIT